MKRFFSGSKSPKLAAPPKNLFSRKGSTSSTGSKDTFSRSSSFGQRLLNGDSSPNLPQFAQEQRDASDSVLNNDLSPELVPIVTLLSAQAHRRYHKGVILVLHDLKNDGTPATGKWTECYAVLLGTQLALWEAKEIAGLQEGDNSTRVISSSLKKAASTPKYINLADCALRPLDSDDSVLSNDGRNVDLSNVLVVSTTLKNRYFLQFSDKNSYDEWTAAFRLSLYENVSLQEAYTGAFLSSRGSKLSDIKVIMDERNKFSYSEWVSVRFGAGMPWKRCFAVVSQSTGKKKNGSPFGKISFYDNDKKVNKKSVMVTITEARRAYAVYPSAPVLIDNSTILKLEGSIIFSDKDGNSEDCNVFIMAEKHQGVGSYDTIIRFLIPVMNAFALYGRPKQLIADRDDPNSLMFALPILPAIYYLEVKDILDMIRANETSPWNQDDWNSNIDELLKTKKLEEGYTGCGQKGRLPSTFSSPTLGPDDLFRGPNSPVFSNPPSLRSDKLLNASPQSRILDRISDSAEFLPTSHELPKIIDANEDAESSVASSSKESVVLNPFETAEDLNGVAIPEGYEQQHTPGNESASRRSMPNNKQPELPIVSPHIESNDEYPNNTSAIQAGELSELYDKYAIAPFGATHESSTGDNLEPKPMFLATEQETSRYSNGYESPYENYVGTTNDSKRFEISNIRDSRSTADYDDDVKAAASFKSAMATNESNSSTGLLDVDHAFDELADKINEVNIVQKLDSVNTDTTAKYDEFGDDDELAPVLKLQLTQTTGNGTQNRHVEKDEEADVFDPDFVDQSQMLGAETAFKNEEDNVSATNQAYNLEKKSSIPRSPSQTNLALDANTSNRTNQQTVNSPQRIQQPLQQPRYASPSHIQSPYHQYSQNNQSPIYGQFPNSSKGLPSESLQHPKYQNAVYPNQIQYQQNQYVEQPGINKPRQIGSPYGSANSRSGSSLSLNNRPNGGGFSQFMPNNTNGKNPYAN
ncbi:Skg3p KNAG_0C00690 [Huiozyma naganishii CBS 8797]|uniref:PH domain-containing protein n=1 Tax=Huiozyma naganishii (strain ATCC MYA-139 / BCRC 22969 / CBS 8797 / KCTC 17520 / NBRC 10181 / NCYC 3082 / Yp74L-3) TaxID=1071383 RepID=J7RW31_HUIN7|nr:hypothetical protein KNAG_0C00690 [Kazachstania naganishii CBS 8797]CCK69182.1 hypothetical protein KNAG_0C00690 [Kazachstania naganishii CBS 8797]